VEAEKFKLNLKIKMKKNTIKTNMQKNLSLPNTFIFIILFLLTFFGESNISKAASCSASYPSCSSTQINVTANVTGGGYYINNSPSLGRTCTVVGGTNYCAQNPYDFGSNSVSLYLYNSVGTLVCNGFTASNPGCPPPPPPPPPAPSVTLSASPSRVNLGDTSVLSWTISGATSCTQSSTLGNWTLSSPVSGSLTINNVTVNQAFSLTCTNSSGNTTASSSISVNTNLYAIPRILNKGGSIIFQWLSAFGNNCSISGPGVSLSGSSSGAIQGPLNVSRNGLFNLNCISGSFLSTSSVKVMVTPKFYCSA
jgi:hypothetical protein